MSVRDILFVPIMVFCKRGNLNKRADRPGNKIFIFVVAVVVVVIAQKSQHDLDLIVKYSNRGPSNWLAHPKVTCSKRFDLNPGKLEEPATNR